MKPVFHINWLASGQNRALAVPFFVQTECKVASILFFFFFFKLLELYYQTLVNLSQSYKMISGCMKVEEL